MAKEKQESKEHEHEELDRSKEVALKTHLSINQELCGEIEYMDNFMVKLKLETTYDMLAEENGLIHSGFIFGAADYAAMAVVNDKNVVLVASDCQFLSPVRMGDTVNFKAKVRHKEGRKRNVHVIGEVMDIKVFDGEFKTVITENNILNTKLLDEKDD
ncbi:MAG: hotdog domain-containing protein [Sulfurimonas sp.]|jgi:acyl-CoA thioesterase|nr:hotdog domain-containing protein [Sulfurimonadaceae bacterium]